MVVIEGKHGCYGSPGQTPGAPNSSKAGRETSELRYTPKIRDPNIDTKVVGILLQGHPKKGPPNLWKRPFMVPLGHYLTYFGDPGSVSPTRVQVEAACLQSFSRVSVVPGDSYIVLFWVAYYNPQ